jgi:hypothetical protein
MMKSGFLPILIPASVRQVSTEKLGWQATGTFMGNNEVLKLGKGKNPIDNTPTDWAATFSTSASEQDQ